ncbi:MAG: transporter related protein [Nocardioides sp.]|nr:transporter related protein [Nocardioides sp.]
MTGDANPVALQMEEVTKVYSNGQTIGPVSMTVRSGSCFGLIGANGAGKSTLMRVVLGLTGSTEGSVLLFTDLVVPGVPSPRASGMIEEPQFFRWMNATENLRAVFAGRREVYDQIPAVLDEVGLGEVGGRPVRAFSQGMRQRLGLARVLLADPDLLVLDEPTNGLDPLGIRWLRGLIRRLVDDGKSVLLSSHLLHEVQQVADDYLMIDRGSAVAHGRVRDIEHFSGLEDLYLSKIAGPDDR